MNKTLIGILAVAVIAIGAYFFPNVSPVVQNVIGANPGNDNSSSCTTQGGVTVCKYRQALQKGTATPCIIVPRGIGTSTLISTNVLVTTSTSTATYWRWSTGTSTPSLATATSLGVVPLSSGALGSLSATTTSVALSTNAPDGTNIIAPNYGIIWSIEGTVISDTTKLNGFCSAVFQQV